MASLPSDPNSAADSASAANNSRMEDLARQPIGGLGLQVENPAIAHRPAQGQPPVPAPKGRPAHTH